MSSSVEAQGRYRWLLNRLRCMSAAEMRYRAAQALGNRWRRLFPLDVRAPAMDAAPRQRTWLTQPADMPDAQPYLDEAGLIAQGSVRLFASQRYPVGAVPDWHRCPLTGVVAPAWPRHAIAITDKTQVGDIKFVWELNRHLHWVTLAQAWVLGRDLVHLQVLRRQLRAWLDQCQPGVGPNWTSSLELGIRLLNWSAVWQLVGGEASALFDGDDGPALRQDWMASVYAHVLTVTRHYSRHSSANNHVIGELAGVYVASRLWPCWPEVRRLGDAALEALEQQMLLQTSEDGVNREQAFEYATFVFDFFALSERTAAAAGDAVSPQFLDRMAGMCVFIRSLMSCHGAVPSVGDADGAQAVRLDPRPARSPFDAMLAKGARLFDRPDWAPLQAPPADDARWLYGAADFKPHPSSRELAASFADGGYELFGSDWGGPREIKGLMDVGPLGYLGIAAHGHADALQVCLAVAGEPVLIDPGTYAYWAEREWRDYFRGTSAHNTVCIDGRDQSESGGRFMWTRKAQVRHVSRHQSRSGVVRIRAEHDGYECLPGRYLHRRELSFDPAADLVEVHDEVLGHQPAHMALHWHVAPQWRLTMLGDTAMLQGQGVCLQISVSSSTPGEWQAVSGQMEPPLGWYSDQYHEKQPCVCLRWQAHVETVRVTTRIQVIFEERKA